MVSKLKLASFISKYYLNGLNNQTKWKITDNTLEVYAGAPGKMCNVELKGFEFEDATLGIFDTHKLTKLLAITNGDLSFESEKLNKLHQKLKISDIHYDLVFTLADTLIFRKLQYYEDPGEWVIEVPLTPEIILHLIKAKNALGDLNKMLITTTPNLDGQTVCKIQFGDETGFSNKVSYQLESDVIEDGIKIPFNSDIFRDILNSNKDMIKGKLKINKMGMMKLNFEGENIKSEYYLIKDE